jgi:hypothetical protein
LGQLRSRKRNREKKGKRKGKEGKKEKRQKTTPLFFRLFPDCVLCFVTELKDPQTWEGVDMTFASHHKRILASWGNPGAENETGKKRKKGKKEKGEKKEKRKRGKEGKNAKRQNNPPCFFRLFPDCDFSRVRQTVCSEQHSIKGHTRRPLLKKKEKKKKGNTHRKKGR